MTAYNAFIEAIPFVGAMGLTVWLACLLGIFTEEYVPVHPKLTGWIVIIGSTAFYYLACVALLLLLTNS